MLKLQSLGLSPLHVELNEPFGIATGAHQAVDNVLVKLELNDGSVGLGEAAPVPHISGEQQAAVLASRQEVELALRPLDLSDFRRVSAVLGETLGHLPSARAGVEMALLDALTRRANLPLRAFFGGAETCLKIDLTIPTGDLAHARASATRAAERDFHQLKVKVGGAALDLDVARVLAIAAAAPHQTLLLDGNTAFTAETAVELIRQLAPIREKIALFEQPVVAEDFDGLREVEAKTGIPVAADESLRSFDDLRRIVRTGGISAINVKTAKVGLVQALDLLLAARTLGLRTMVGGMVETELSMSASACLAAGIGGVDFVDLDTPLFLRDSPFARAPIAWGPTLDLSRLKSGHGVELSAH